MSEHKTLHELWKDFVAASAVLIVVVLGAMLVRFHFAW
jgi:hypothetical protein